ncbi:MAG: efflux transporter outer membrane subunit [Phycisphaerae bacterium]|nr:efflux transporter outer membrane subunit [Phycisphaerae bacterium]
MRANRLFILALAVAAVSGCKVGPEYVRPSVDLPGEFRGASADPASIADLPWWDVFQDPVLHSLIREALDNNYDLRVAVSRIEQARAIAAQSKAALYPQIGYDANVSGGRNEFIGSPAYNAGDTRGSLGAFLTASWEFDIWGRLARLNEADLQDVLATVEAKNAIRLGLVAEVAQAYFELLQLDQELAIYKQAVISFEETLRIFTLRRDFGTASNLEVSRGQAALSQEAAQVPRTELAITLKENQINVLLGRPPRDIPRGATLDKQPVPPDMPAGVPAQLLERRPDIMGAEANVRAANERVGATEALKLPQIGLTSFFGQASPDLEDISSTGIAWSIAANVAGPIFDAGLTNAQIAQAKAVWEQAVLQYDRTVLVALREVADALTSRLKLKDVRVEAAKTVTAYEESVSVATERYMAGKASYYEVLDAQQKLYPAQRLLSQTEAEQFIAVVRLYKALGGGWTLKDDQWNGTTTAEAPALATPSAAAPQPASVQP